MKNDLEGDEKIGLGPLVGGCGLQMEHTGSRVVCNGI